MTDPRSTRLLYRIIAAGSLTPIDFFPYAVLKKPLPEGAPPEVADRWHVISMYDSEERARAVAVRFGLGTHIAALDLTDDRSFRVERTGQRAGHYTVWGDPSALLARVGMRLKAGRLPRGLDAGSAGFPVCVRLAGWKSAQRAAGYHRGNSEDRPDFRRFPRVVAVTLV